MKCSKCGAEIKANMKFCNKCGAKVTLETETGYAEKAKKEIVETSMDSASASSELKTNPKEVLSDTQTIQKSISDSQDTPNNSPMQSTSSSVSTQNDIVGKECNDGIRVEKKKSKKVAGFLAIFFGFFGIHWFYLGRVLRGIIYLVAYLFVPYLWFLYVIEGLFFLFCKEESFERYVNRKSKK